MLQEEIRHHSLEVAKQIWRASTAHIYGWGDKNSKLLHWLASRPLAGRIIPEVEDNCGRMCCSSLATALVFADHYATLYAAAPRSETEKTIPLIDDIPLPKISGGRKVSIG